ncbi:hypothetical protein ACFRMN_24420 [Streptomyces sp. NPDC056835]|uniref:hypothetical protein n=1 Tax=Streptomyces sp. NPDC056835 TaxID=3345956 RepID=UPI00367B3CAF
MPSEKPFEEPFENGLGEALRRTGETFAPTDGTALVDAGLTRGRRRLARRRAAAVTGSVFALAAVGIGGAYGGGLLDGGGGQDGRTSVAAPATTPAGPGPGNDAELLAILAGLLPGGELKMPTTLSPPSIPGYRSVRGSFDDGKGAAVVTVGLIRADRTGTGADQQVTCPDKAFIPHENCVESELAGGSRLMVLEGAEYGDRPEGTKSWRAVLYTSDGFLVEATAYNVPPQKGGGIARTDPPLSPARLKALVTSDEWRGPLNELPALPSARQPADGGSGTSADPDAGRP